MTYLPSGLDYIRSLETATVYPALDTATVRQCLGDTETAILLHFYRAMLCIRGTSHGPVSVSVCLSVCLSVFVCLSVTSRSSTKTAKHRITKTTPHDSTGTLVI